jgi:uncharacterized membrane protein
MSRRESAWLAACAAMVALILLSLAWELWLAPLRPGGSWLVLKVVPLLVPLFGPPARPPVRLPGVDAPHLDLCRRRRHARAHGLGDSARLAALELVLALAFFVAAVAYVRSTRP